MSNQQEQFASGAVRDSNAGKPRYDLISPFALRRLALQMMKGATPKDRGGFGYGPRNWEKGMSIARMYESAERHLKDWALGKDGEDNLAAAVFNIMGIMHFEDMKRTDLMDHPRYTQWRLEEPEGGKGEQLVEDIGRCCVCSAYFDIVKAPQGNNTRAHDPDRYFVWCKCGAPNMPTWARERANGR